MAQTGAKHKNGMTPQYTGNEEAVQLLIYNQLRPPTEKGNAEKGYQSI